MKKAYYFLLMSLVAFPLTILSCTSSAKKGESSETPADSTSTDYLVMHFFRKKRRV